MDKSIDRPPMPIRFRTPSGKWLGTEISRIEALATERLRAGVSLHSAQQGARALLRGLLDEVAGDAVELAPDAAWFPACPLPAQPPRCSDTEPQP